MLVGHTEIVVAPGLAGGDSGADDLDRFVEVNIKRVVGFQRTESGPVKVGRQCTRSPISLICRCLHVMKNA